jgi:hypothetical protein
MKNFLYTALILLLSASSLFSKFDLGLKAGYNASKLNTNMSGISSDFRSGALIGAFARIGESLFFQPELLYSSNGGEFSSTIQGIPNVITNLKQSSFDLCAMAGYKLINSVTFSINGQAGLVASIMTDKGAWYLENDTNNDFQSVNWALKFGAGIDFSKLSLDIRYLLGLNNVNSSSQLDLTNSRVEVTLGLRILSF